MIKQFIEKKRVCSKCKKNKKITLFGRKNLNKDGYANVCRECDNNQTKLRYPDYTKPLEVRWLCRVHHMELHRLPSPPLLNKDNYRELSKKREKKVKVFLKKGYTNKQIKDKLGYESYAGVNRIVTRVLSDNQTKE